MRPWALISLLGLVISVFLSVYLTSATPSNFLNLPGFLLVFGGSLLALLIAHPPSRVAAAFKRIPHMLLDNQKQKDDFVEEIVRYTKIWQSANVQDLEKATAHCKSPFLKHGLEMLADNLTVEEIHSVLQWRMKLLAERERAQAGVFDDLAQFSPAFGMVGTLLGLVNMLGVMDPAEGVQVIGANMAVALITTFYGVLLANGLFKPLAKRHRAITMEQLDLLGLVMQGVEMMSEKRTPSYIRATLIGMQHGSADELGALK